MMLDRMFVSDIQKEIMDMQMDLSKLSQHNSLINSSKRMPSPKLQPNIKTETINGITITSNQDTAGNPYFKQNVMDDIKLLQQQMQQLNQRNLHSAESLPEMLRQHKFGRNSQDISTFGDPTKSEIKIETESPRNNESFYFPSSNRQLLRNPLNMQLKLTTPTQKKEKTEHIDSKSFVNCSNVSRIMSPVNVKKENNLDIETELAKSFIIKKSNSDLIDQKPNLEHAEFPCDYLCSPTAAGTSPLLNCKKKTEDEPKEPYDEWLCIQKELSLITERRPIIMDHDSKLNEMYNHANISPKMSVESQLCDLFNNQSPPTIKSQDSPLSELFSPNASSQPTSISSKSVETRLEAMFGDNSDMEKSNDLVEARLDALFQGSSSPVSEHQTQMLHHEFLMMQPHSQSSSSLHSIHPSNNKRQWNNNGNSELLPSSPISPSMYAKRSCMVSNYTDEHTNRWSPDCQQQSFDFESNGHGITGSSGGGKRNWNGDILTHSSLDQMCQPKKNHYNHINKLHHEMERDILSLETSPHSLEHGGMLSLHSLHGDNTFDSITALGSNNNPNTSNNSMTSNFDDDINRHVQNAIDSILNLQNSEADSLHFTLDQTMNSFLADSPIGGGIVNPSSTGNSMTGSGSIHRHSTMTSTSGNNRRRTNRLDDISDCLISGGGSEVVDSGGIIIDSSPPPSMSVASSGVGVGVSDFNIIGGIDEAIKSIITS